MQNVQEIIVTIDAVQGFLEEDELDRLGEAVDAVQRLATGRRRLSTRCCASSNVFRSMTGSRASGQSCTRSVGCRVIRRGLIENKSAGNVPSLFSSLMVMRMLNADIGNVDGYDLLDLLRTTAVGSECPARSSTRSYKTFSTTTRGEDRRESPRPYTSRTCPPSAETARPPDPARPARPRRGRGPAARRATSRPGRSSWRWPERRRRGVPHRQTLARRGRHGRGQELRLPPARHRRGRPPQEEGRDLHAHDQSSGAARREGHPAAAKPFTAGEFSAVLVKGRGNYVCRRRLDSASRRAHTLFNERQSDALFASRGVGRAKEDHDGSVSSLARRAGFAACGTRSGPRRATAWASGATFFKGCHWQAAKRRMNTGNVLVVNHALFFSDLALRLAGVNYLPKYDHVVSGRGAHDRGRGRPALRHQARRGVA